MKRWSQCTMFVVTILMVLAISAMSAFPVLADDEPPPPTETPEVVQPPDQDPGAELPPVEAPTQAPEASPTEVATIATEAPVVSTEAAPATEAPAVSTEQAPVVKEAPAAAPTKAPVAEETPAQEPVQEEAPPAMLAQLPENTDVVVLDENGEALPLASAESAEIITAGDPVWCPAGVTPGGAGCSPSGTSLQAVINWLLANDPGKAGVIWIEKSYDSSVNDPASTGFTLDGTLFTNLDNFGLTLKGGWNGSGTGTVTNDPSVFSGDSLNIINWNGSITISDILITGVAGGGSTALNISTSQNIGLTRVDVSSNAGSGALLDNTAGGAGVGSVTIANSNFSNNAGGRGLDVRSRGTIAANAVKANNNGGGGASLDNSSAATLKNVTLVSGLYEFNNNGGTGLSIWSKGVITLKDMNAINNGGRGAYLDSCLDFGGGCTNTAASGVMLTGTNIFSENGTDGLVVFNRGAITIQNLVANSNAGGWGAYLDNDEALTAQAVTLSGSSQFKYNGGGLEILSKGAITLNNINASNNILFGGAYLNNVDSPLSSNVTLTGINLFNDNAGGTGLQIVSHGIVTLSNITANNNGRVATPGYGADLDNSAIGVPKAIILNGVNTFNGNYSGGLVIASLGTVTLNKITANDNTNGRGVDIDNTWGPNTLPQNVSMLGYVQTNRNGGDGLHVWSFGLITLNNVTTTFNGGDGAYLDNCNWDGANCLTTTPKAVTLSGNNTFNNNQEDGVQIFSKGVITLNNVVADGNVTGNGAYLDNDLPGAVGGITVNNTPTFFPSFSYNGDTGLVVWSTGNILLKDLDAYGNGGHGVYLNNTDGAASTVMVGTSRLGWCNSLGGNFYSGLEVYSNGAVTLSNLCNSSNGGDNGVDPLYGYGLYVDNSTAATPKTVTLLGANSFYNNFSGGVHIFTDGAITAYRVTASGNSGTGALFDNNSNPAVPQNVTLVGYGDFENNAGRGLDIATYGTVTLSNIYTNNNSGDGIHVDNFTGATLPRGVTINGYAESFNNGGIGLNVITLGAIRVTNLDTENNSAGASLNNYGLGTTANSVVITGHAWAYDNSTYGLDVFTRGAITIASLDASYNGSGATLDNAVPGSVGTVTITGYAEATNNAGGNGLVITSNRAITLTNLYANNNSGAGVVLQNTTSGHLSPQNVTVNGYSSLYNNGDTGLVISTYGQITLNNVTANGNGTNDGSFGWGAFLDNGCVDLGGGCTATMVKGITLNGTNTFNGNYQDGLYANSRGVIKANNLTANNNGVPLTAGYGALLGNQYGVGYYGVLLTGSNSFENNAGDGLDVFTNGTVTISNLTANGNTGDGAYIDAFNDLTPPGSKVTLTGTNTFIGNGDGTVGPGTDPGSGLIVYSDSVITINNLTASQNTQNGAVLTANNGGFWSPFPASIKLTGVNTFNNNGLDGLYFDSPGNVDITKLTADNNGGDGLFGLADGNITLTCGSMTNNTGYGWSLNASGVVTLKGVFAYGNGTNTNPVAGTFVYVRTCPLP